MSLMKIEHKMCPRTIANGAVKQMNTPMLVKFFVPAGSYRSIGSLLEVLNKIVSKPSAGGLEFTLVGKAAKKLQLQGCTTTT